jgi:DtxR family manganese transport transcriptional regulator
LFLTIMPRAKKVAPAASPTRAPAAPRAADSLRSTRADHARETAEDYVEAIADLIAATGEARVTDLARELGVSHVTVNRTIARLQRDGYVTSQPYRAIFLTDTGQELAVVSRQRHETVVRFLRSLGVPQGSAERDAEGIEHHVSPETLAAFERTLKRAGK